MKLGLGLIFCALACWIEYPAQAPTFLESQHNADIIDVVVSYLVYGLRHGSSVQNFLLPTLSEKQKQENLGLTRKRFLDLSIDYEDQDLRILDSTRARLRARVTWRTAEENASYVTTIHFEKIGEDWYFSDYSFLIPPLIPEHVVWIAGALTVFLLVLGILKLRSKHRSGTSTT